MSSIAVERMRRSRQNDSDVDLKLPMSQSSIKQTEFLFPQGNLEGYQSASDPNPRRLDDLEGNPGAQSPGRL